MLRIICFSAILAACVPIGWFGLYIIGQIRERQEELKKLSPEDREFVKSVGA